MKIFDSHVHVESGLESYDLDITQKNVIFNSITSYLTHKKVVSKKDSISLIFDYSNHLDFIVNEANSNSINALKIHSRVQNLRPNDYPELINKLELIPSYLPIIIDCFYFGTDLIYQPNLLQIINIITYFPNRKFVIAHAGGYEILKYFFHLRTLKNVFYELSFSLQYLYDTSLYLDLKKLIKYTDKNRILFGSDYAFASPKLQLGILIEIADELNLSLEELELITYYNSYNLFISSIKT